ncbi:MAG: DUF502 domain-containing protein [Myxococcota bacterium]|jgi:uncharacterized membrane protein|nr:DUF502 domain-containing protein [Myxococcota bacterium]
MRNLFELIKTTVIGGFFGLLPIIAIIFIVSESLDVIGMATTPIANNLPVKKLGGTEIAQILSFLILLGFCFTVGALFQTRSGERATRWIGEHVFDRIPGYNVLRGLSASFAGEDDTTRFSPAAVDLYGSGVFSIAFIVEELKDGGFMVFVPITPTPSLGTLYYAPPERIRHLDVPLATALNCILQWGVGSSQLIDSASLPLRSPTK